MRGITHKFYGIIILSFVLFISALFSSGVAYAADPAVITKKSGLGFEQCYTSNDDSTNAFSPFSKTSTLCVGLSSNESTSVYFQFAIKFAGNVSNPTITVKDTKTTANLKFVEDTENGTVYYVSQTAYRATAVDSMSASCESLPTSAITVTVSANNTSQSFSKNLCSQFAQGGLTTDNSKALIYFDATNIKTDSGSASTSKGSISGLLGIIRADAPSGDPCRTGLLKKVGVSSMKLSGGPTAETGDANSGWFDLNNGNLSIGSLSPGTYNLKIAYNDIAATEVASDNCKVYASSTNYPINFSGIIVKSGQNTVIGNQKTATYYDKDGKNVDPNSSSTDTKTTAQSTCAVTGVGWLVCPVINFLAGIADKAFDFLADNFLSVSPSLLNTDPAAKDSSGNVIGTGAYTAWQSIRTFANVVLVIAFLIIIFSQLTGFGINNYGIKKLLPKLVIVAILINISFFICQIGVDLSNVLGVGLKSLLAGAVSVPQAVKTATATTTGSGWVGIAGTVLAGGAATGVAVAASGGITLALVALIGMLISSVIAVLMIFFILIVREMLIILLVVLAPLAFAAYLLPNTGDLFKKWSKLFFQMLILFPVIGVIFGGSTLASNVLKSAYASSGSMLAQIIASGVLVLPLFLVPSVLKGALKGIGTIGTKIGGLGSQWGGAANKGVTSGYANSNFGKYQRGKRDIDAALSRAGSYSGKNPFIRLSSNIHGGINGNSVLNKLNRGYGNAQSAAGVKLAEGQSNDEIVAAASQLKFARLNQAQTRDLVNGNAVEYTNPVGNEVKLDASKNSNLKAAAIQSMVASNDVVGINSLWDSSKGWTGPDGDKLRTVFADSLQASGSRPAYIGQAAIASIRQNGHETIDKTIISAVNANAYSPEKIAKADQDELKKVNQVLAEYGSVGGTGDIKDDAHQRIAFNANKAANDPLLSGLVAKNIDQIDILQMKKDAAPEEPTKK